ncbi:hypothetical protein LCGC14_3075020 [marine sediment metagenome]|uniref:Uncharacterized protein n=1 Tax=marine sediment metagenome TaxID=412755 RepID=A0A0F8X3G0_9ZZZZ
MAAKDSEKKNEAPATPAEEAPAQVEQRQIQLRMDDQEMRTIYSNGFRTSTTPEELLLDFGLNVPVLSEQSEGQPVYQLKLEVRIIMNYGTARRLVQMLTPLIRRREEQLGESVSSGAQNG